MTLLHAYTGPTSEPPGDAFKARVAGKSLGELLAIRGDLAERISHFDGSQNEWHDRTVSEGTTPGAHPMFRDLEMERVARLRGEFAYVTDVIAQGGIA